jgi:hypothetical protein
MLRLAMIEIHGEILAEIGSKAASVYAAHAHSPIHSSDEGDFPKVFPLHLYQVRLQLLISTRLARKSRGMVASQAAEKLMLDSSFERARLQPSRNNAPFDDRL